MTYLKQVNPQGWKKRREQQAGTAEKMKKSLGLIIPVVLAKLP